MSRNRFLAVLLLAVSLVCGPAAPPAGAWGASAHMMLTTAAVDRMQGPVGDFFRANRHFLICYSILPDSWWGSPELLGQLPKGLENPAGTNGPKELGRHHFAEDEEAYAESMPARSEARVVPLDRAQALEVFRKHVEKHGQEALDRFRRQNSWFKGGLAELPAAMLEKAGELPWVIDERVNDMAAAMRSGNWVRAMLLATVLAHYVGDAHVPLHTTVNYNAQFHPNPLLKGLHQRWEGRIIELRKAEFRKFLRELIRSARTPPAKMPSDPGALRTAVFEMIADTFSLTDDILRVDDELLAHAGALGASPQPSKDRPDSGAYTPEYFRKFYERLGPGIKGQLGRSVERITSLWGVAWERAGRPQPPTGNVETPPLVVIDFRNDRIVPYQPDRN